jgi:hypothetical protein
MISYSSDNISVSSERFISESSTIKIFFLPFIILHSVVFRILGQPGGAHVLPLARRIALALGRAVALRKHPQNVRATAGPFLLLTGAFRPFALPLVQERKLLHLYNKSFSQFCKVSAAHFC